MIPSELTGRLAAICGSDGVIVDPDRLLVYESDALTAYRHRPGAVVLPRTTEELRRSVAEVARSAGIREGTVKSRLHRALSQMRDLLEQSGVMEVAGNDA